MGNKFFVFIIFFLEREELKTLIHILVFLLVFLFIKIDHYCEVSTKKFWFWVYKKCLFCILYVSCVHESLQHPNWKQPINTTFGQTKRIENREVNIKIVVLFAQTEKKKVLKIDFYLLLPPRRKSLKDGSAHLCVFLYDLTTFISLNCSFVFLFSFIFWVALSL